MINDSLLPWELITNYAYHELQRGNHTAAQVTEWLIAGLRLEIKKCTQLSDPRLTPIMEEYGRQLEILEERGLEALVRHAGKGVKIGPNAPTVDACSTELLKLFFPYLGRDSNN